MVGVAIEVNECTSITNSSVLFKSFLMKEVKQVYSHGRKL